MGISVQRSRTGGPRGQAPGLVKMATGRVRILASPVEPRSLPHAHTPLAPRVPLPCVLALPRPPLAPCPPALTGYL